MAELDREYLRFHAKWKSRLGLKDVHLAKGYMRHEANKAEGVYAVSEPNSAAVYILVDDRAVEAYVEPDGLATLVEEWSAALAESCKGDRRAFTKNFICQTVALGRHSEQGGEMIVCGALWLAASQNEGALGMLSQPGVALRCDFTFDDASRRRRLQISLVDR